MVDTIQMAVEVLIMNPHTINAITMKSVLLIMMTKDTDKDLGKDCKKIAHQAHHVEDVDERKSISVCSQSAGSMKKSKGSISNPPLVTFLKTLFKRL